MCFPHCVHLFSIVFTGQIVSTCFPCLFHLLSMLFSLFVYLFNVVFRSHLFHSCLTCCPYFELTFVHFFSEKTLISNFSGANSFSSHSTWSILVVRVGFSIFEPLNLRFGEVRIWENWFLDTCGPPSQSSIRRDPSVTPTTSTTSTSGTSSTSSTSSIAVVLLVILVILAVLVVVYYL
jgi:hypothetical protein